MYGRIIKKVKEITTLKEMYSQLKGFREKINITDISGYQYFLINFLAYLIKNFHK